jgi:hypothetical protein
MVFKDGLHSKLLAIGQRYPHSIFLGVDSRISRVLLTCSPEISPETLIELGWAIHEKEQVMSVFEVEQVLRRRIEYDSRPEFSLIVLSYLALQNPNGAENCHATGHKQPCDLRASTARQRDNASGTITLQACLLTCLD